MGHVAGEVGLHFVQLALLAQGPHHQIEYQSQDEEDAGRHQEDANHSPEDGAGHGFAVQFISGTAVGDGCHGYVLIP